MSDISFPGLGAFIIFLGLLAVLGLVLLVSIYILMRSKKRWPCHASFGFFMGSSIGLIVTVILLYLTENGSLALMETMDVWAIAIAVVLLLNTCLLGWWFWRKNSGER